MGVIGRHIHRSVNWKAIPRLDVIGLDEIFLKKGHKDFVTIVTGRRGEKTIILAVLKDRQKPTVKTFLESIPLENTTDSHGGLFEGDVCHCHVNSDYRAVGNLNQLPLMEIWNSPEFKRQREEIRQHHNNCICWDQSAALSIFLDS
ncbi:MAG: hypothetical protein GY797_35800, partial [Deltaproteobacteria bacterium]|nr:hypothetical protein [Deltaproteobacteria bacterium]